MSSNATERAYRLLATLLQNGDPYDEPFKEHIYGRTVVYPTGSFTLTHEQLTALGKAADSVGDSSALILITEGWQPQRTSEFLHFDPIEVSLSDPASYFEPPREALYDSLENAILSPSGQWVVLVATDDFALAGGSQEFIETLRSAGDAHGLWDADWLDYWVHEARGTTDTAWVTPLLEHVYGRQRAEALLRVHLDDETRGRLG